MTIWTMMQKFFHRESRSPQPWEKGSLEASDHMAELQWPPESHTVFVPSGAVLQEHPELPEDTEATINHDCVTGKCPSELSAQIPEALSEGTTGLAFVEMSKDRNTETETLVSSQKEFLSSILDNQAYIKLVEDVVSLGDEVAKLRITLPEAAVGFAEYVTAQLEEILDRNGVIPIEEETRYDVRRHQVVPMQLVPDGVEIIQTIKPGWRLGNRIFRRACVKVAVPEDPYRPSFPGQQNN